MNFELSSEQKLLRSTVRSFGKQQSPISRFRELRTARESWEPAVWQHMGELGWLSVPFPEAVGGFGGSFVDVAVLLEGFGATLVPEPYIPSVVLGGMIVSELGSPQQHERWLAPMLDGKTSLAFAHAERTNRFEPTVHDTRATVDGSGYRVRGEKLFVLNGHRADHLVVSAQAPDGPALFVVDRDAVNAQEVRTIDGHGAAMVTLDAKLAGDRLLGSAGTAAADAIDRALDYGAAAACAEALGVCQTVLSMTNKHLKERQQFGVAIGTFQALQHRAVDMFVHVELIRSMSILAAVRATDPDPAVRRAAVSAAKAHVARSGREVTQQAIQLHGGIGITDEHDIGLYFKRMHTLGLLCGDEDHHVRRFASLPAFPTSA